MIREQSAPPLRPASLAEARDAMGSDSQPLLLRGGGTKLDWGAPPAAGSRIIDTGGLSRLLERNAPDMTATVQAGMPLARLQSALGADGQWLAIDPPLGAGRAATVGGIIAANDSGPRRLHYGTMRDLVIGMTIVLSDGAVARTGGKVIKNVAGYDLAKLLCGSLGTLGLIAEVTVRLHPLPEASRTIRIAATPVEAAEVVADLLASPVEPSCLDWADGALRARVEGRGAGVEARAATVRAVAGRRGLDVEDIEAGEEEALWARLTEALAGEPGETVVRGAALPDRFPAVADALNRAAGEAGVDSRLHSHVGLGLHSARLSGGDAAAHARAAVAWRRSLAGLGGHAVVRRRIDGLDGLVSIHGDDPPAVSVMRRVKDALDPGGRCAPGRFAGGL